jgi:acetyl esterase
VLSRTDRAQGALVRALTRLPGPAQRALAGGSAVRIDGLELSHESQLVIALAARVGQPAIDEQSVADARAETVRRAVAVRGAMPPLPRVEEIEIPGPGGVIPARLYAPDPEPGGTGLLVYYHGGGHVIGNLETCEGVCRFLVRESGAAVLAVDYRLAPEHPFPAAVEDAVDALAFASEEAVRLGADPARIAVGGDSAGGNLAAVAAHTGRDGDVPAPAFQLLIYPVCDYSEKRPSYHRFSQGFLLTEAEMDWFRGHYLRGDDDARDPRASPLLAQDLSGLAPAYIATAGFDPLRDEGEEYGRRLAEAGVPVAVRRHEGLLHSYANMTAIGRGAREAMLEAAAALRMGLARRGS